jgi:DNA-binding transcriptional LysR family regulator
MELRQLEGFVAVAEERNFTRAAARLHLAQSGLSATIRTLERELHAPLFLRTTRQVELTEAGAALLGEARRTLASAHAAADAVAAVEGLERGTLTLGIMQASTVIGLPALLARYRRAYPGIELRLRHVPSAEQAQLLYEHAADIIFTTGSAHLPPEVVSIPLVESPLVVTCPPDHPLARRAAVELRAVAGHPQVGFPPGSGVRALADQAIRSRGLEPRYGFEVNDTVTVLDLVEAGLGIALLPTILASIRPHLSQVSIKGRSWTWTIVAETLAPAPPNPAARALWDILPTGTQTTAPDRHQDRRG